MLSRMTHLPPQAPQELIAPKKRGTPLWVWALVAALMVCVVIPVIVGAIKNVVTGDGQAADRPAGQPATPAVDQADLAKYWSENYSAASWFSLTATPTWDGAALVAHTKLYADQDAREPALSICRAMVMYWLTTNKEFRPVRVLDQADAILASAHTEADSCAWRR